jgi:hypothetical protein
MNFMGRASRVSSFRSELAPPDEITSAAQHLRRHYPNVFPCHILLTEFGGDNRRTPVTWGEHKGLPDRGHGYYYIEHVGVVANDALIALARTTGWKA